MIIETVCPDDTEHYRRVTTRYNDLEHFTLPTWDEVKATAREYEAHTDDRLVLDTRRPLSECVEEALAYVRMSSAA
ncbi:MAG: hypothetical protein ABIM89_07225 [Mycobacteriales bacterium]